MKRPKTTHWTSFTTQANRLKFIILSLFLVGAFVSALTRYFKVPDPTLSFITPSGYAAPVPLDKKSITEELMEKTKLRESMLSANEPEPEIQAKPVVKVANKKAKKAHKKLATYRRPAPKRPPFWKMAKISHSSKSAKRVH